MYAPIESKVICKRYKNEGRLPNFHEFWSEEVHSKKKPLQKKPSIFEHYNLWIPWNKGL
jgi:hypothetical protein